MEVTQKQLDDAIEGITNAICTVAHAVLSPADAQMYLTELDNHFGEMNRQLELT